MISESGGNDTGNWIQTRRTGAMSAVKCSLCVTHHLPEDFGLLGSGE